MHISSVCTDMYTEGDHPRAYVHAPPAPHTSVLMSFSSGEDKSKGASPSSQKNQLLLHELLRCLPSVSLQKKKKIQSLFDVSSPSTPFAFTCDTMIWRYKFSDIKSFHSFNDINIAVFGYLFLFYSSSCICAHRHFSHIVSAILLPALG